MQKNKSELIELPACFSLPWSLDSSLFPSPFRSRLLRLSSCQLLLLEPGGVRGSRAGQGFPQGRGGPGHHVGHWRLRLQRLRLSHGQSVSTLPVWASPLGFWAFGCCVHPRELRDGSLACCYATVGNVLLKTECCKNFNIFLFNSHAYYTESKSNTWLSGRSHRSSCLLKENTALHRRLCVGHRLKDVIKTRKLQDRLVLPWTPPRKVTLTPLAHVLVL